MTEKNAATTAATNAAAAPLTLLDHVNTPPAQTWNYLRINDVSFEVPAPNGTRTGAAFNRLPQIFSKVETGLGDEAVRWVERMADGATYVEVPARETHVEPILVSVSDDEPFASFGVMVREGARATIAVSVGARQDALQAASQGSDAGSSRTTTGSTLRVIAERGSEVEIVEIVASGAGRQHLEAIGIDVAEGAAVTVRQYALGGAKVAMGIAANLAGDSSRLELASRYVVRDRDQLDVNHVVRQRGRNTRSDIQTTGVLMDGARKTMRETIDLIHGAKNSRGNEVETVLVCGEDVVNKTLPVILCDEEDVQGNHGATIGSVSPEQVAYLACRGLSERDVEDLFGRALFDDALNHAPDPTSRAAVIGRATAVLGDSFAEEAAFDEGADATCIAPGNPESER
ncbi:MAG: SufD family Fe-S cluster assembly protein [Olsenella sp.]|nr:SufD family Fe-S cluster assembly protein [Olsenella sp.]